MLCGQTQRQLKRKPHARRMIECNAHIARALYADYRVQNPQSCLSRTTGSAHASSTNVLLDTKCSKKSRREGQCRNQVNARTTTRAARGSNRAHKPSTTCSRILARKHSIQKGPCVCAATAPRREGHQWWFALDSFPTSTPRHCMSVCLSHCRV